MAVTLTPQQTEWIGARVASGDFASVEDATRRLIDQSIAACDAQGQDLAWAKPLVDEAREAVARGASMTLEEHRARNAARLTALTR